MCYGVCGLRVQRVWGYMAYDTSQAKDTGTVAIRKWLSRYTMV